MAEQELSLQAALEYADSRRVFSDVNSRVMVVLADAVRGAEAEWEYAVAEVYDHVTYVYGNGEEGRYFPSAEAARAASVEDSDVVMRRHPAGPWEPVPENGDET